MNHRPRRRSGTTERLAACLIVLAVFLSGCSGLPAVYSGGSPPGTYTVRKGDTLYSIAFRYGLDYKSLARINGIRAPYVIYPRQVLKLKGSAKLPEKDSGPTATPKSPPKVTTTKTTPLPDIPKDPVSAWRWPLEGRVIRGFSLVQPINKGIDIAGKRGDKVAAAADGVVVYAGGNLRGYGKLVIIKHNDTFLSAYGNNEKLLVKEGEKITAGKAIARVGASNDDVEMLHFEIRRDGKPVNPMDYLPRR